MERRGSLFASFYYHSNAIYLFLLKFADKWDLKSMSNPISYHWHLSKTGQMYSSYLLLFRTFYFLQIIFSSFIHIDAVTIQHLFVCSCACMHAIVLAPLCKTLFWRLKQFQWYYLPRSIHRKFGIYGIGWALWSERTANRLNFDITNMLQVTLN